MQLKTETLELRGMKHSVSSKGNVYYTVYCEESTGEPCNFYFENDKNFPKDLKKGDIVRIHLNYNQRFKSLVGSKIELVNKEK